MIRTSWARISIQFLGNSAVSYTDLQVTLARVRRCPPSGPPGEEVAPGQWLLEVVARAAEGAHPAAARAIGAPHGREAPGLRGPRLFGSCSIHDQIAHTLRGMLGSSGNHVIPDLCIVAGSFGAMLEPPVELEKT